MRILVINGPNLNMLGKRDPSQYGRDSLDAIEGRVGDRAKELGVEATFFQSNHEGAIVDYLQASAAEADGVLMTVPQEERARVEEILPFWRVVPD